MQLTPDQQAQVSAFNAKYPGFNVNSVRELSRVASRFGPEATRDYFTLIQSLGMGNGGPNENSFLNPATGKIRQEMSGTRAALTYLGLPAAAIAAPHLMPMITGGGGTAANGYALANAIPSSVGLQGIPLAASSAAGAGAGTLGSMIAGAGIPAGINAVAGIYGARTQANAANQSAQAQIDAANRAAELQYQSTQEALKFQRENEEQRRKEHADTEARNFGIDQDERDYTRGQRDQTLARLAPYRGMGLGALAQLGKPIPMAAPGSIGDLLQRRTA